MNAQEKEIQRTIWREQEAEERAAIPRICGTCRKREPESGYCVMWGKPTDSTATCSVWVIEED